MTAFSAFGLHVAIDAGGVPIAPLLASRLPAFPDAGTGHPDLVYRVRRRRDRIAVVRGHRAVAWSATTEAAADALVRDLQAAFGRLSPGFTFIHAGVVALAGRALILPGRSGAGKTTLVEALLRAGADYGSDEFAVLDARGWVSPYSRPLRVRGEAGNCRRTRAEILGACALTGPLPVDLVIVTEFVRGGVFQPQAISAVESALHLMAHALGARSRPAESLDAIRRTTMGARGIRGSRGEASEAADRIMALQAVTGGP